MPQRRYASVHVVGTNGKSSAVALTSALLERSGLATGAYVSPHARRWSERVCVRGREIGADQFAEAVGRVAEAVPAVERQLEPGDAVTQFEAATAAAFVALATAGVEVAIVEAGLGGRLDATNVLPSRVTALTSIGLEHTAYLGETEVEIAAEKLAVLNEHSALVCGRLSGEVSALAKRTAAERHARFVDASVPAAVPALARRAPYLARNLAVAVAAAQEIAGPLAGGLVSDVAAGLPLAGRMELREGDPPELRDAAHNPDGARALAEALNGVAAGRPIVACVAVLEGKDAGAMLEALAPHLAAMVATHLPSESLAGGGRPGAASLPTAALAAAASAAGLGEVHEVDDPAVAIERARELARERGGVALVTGSHYLLGYGS